MQTVIFAYRIQITRIHAGWQSERRDVILWRLMNDRVCYKRTWFSRRRTRRFLWVLWILCAKISHADHADRRRFYSAWDSCYLNAISKERTSKGWLARPAIREIREIRVLSKRYSARNICSSVLLSKNTCEVCVSLRRLREKNMFFCLKTETP